MCKFLKVLGKIAAIFSAIIGVLFVVYFWNLDQKLLGWAYVQVNKIFDRKKVDIKLGKSDNLMNKFEQAIYNSSRTNKAKAENNPNNMRAIALLRSLSMQGKSLSEMTDLLNEQGFVTSKGCQFQITEVKRLLVRVGLM